MKSDIIVICFIAINLIGFLVNCTDKFKAKHDKWRIPESTLWITGILGGATGSYIAMKLIHHKTRHRSFMIGMPVLSIIQIAGLIYLYSLMR